MSAKARAASSPPLPAPASTVASEATLALAHALRTPLTSLALGLGLLDDGVLGALADGQRDVVHTLVGEVARLTALVDRELDTKPLGAYAGPVERVGVDLSELVRRAAEPIERQARDRGVVIQGSLPGGVRVAADPVKLGWVAVSLMGNALRYSPSGAIIEVEVRGSGLEATLSVKDRGPGLEPDVVARIFDRAMGSGLFLAREIVESHGGHIAAASAGGGRGTTFTITLPLALGREGDGEDS